MSPDQRFAILLIMIGGLFTLIGWTFKRYVARQDARWAKVDELIHTDTVEQAEKPQWVQRMERLEAGLVNLSETVSTLGRLQARTDVLLEERLGNAIRNENERRPL